MRFGKKRPGDRRRAGADGEDANAPSTALAMVEAPDPLARFANRSGPSLTGSSPARMFPLLDPQGEREAPMGIDKQGLARRLGAAATAAAVLGRSEEHTSELQSR